MGKPRQPKHKTEHDIFHMRVHQDWLAIVTQAARTVDLSVSAYIRESVNRQLIADGFKLPERQS
jgi:hypothetical protein